MLGRFAICPAMEVQFGEYSAVLSVHHVQDRGYFGVADLAWGKGPITYRSTIRCSDAFASEEEALQDAKERVRRRALDR